MSGGVNLKYVMVSVFFVSSIRLPLVGAVFLSPCAPRHTS